MLLREIQSERDMRAASMLSLAGTAGLWWFTMSSMAETVQEMGANAQRYYTGWTRGLCYLGFFSLIPVMCAWSLWRFCAIGRWFAIGFVVLLGIANGWLLSWFEGLGQLLESLVGHPLLNLPIAMGIPCLGGVLWALLRPGAGRVCMEEYRTIVAAELGTNTRWWASWIFWAGCPVVCLLANVFMRALEMAIIC